MLALEVDSVGLQRAGRIKILACGDRNWSDKALIRKTLSVYPQGTVLIVGGARGADTIAENCGFELGFVVRVFVADWDRYGRSAGPMRNRKMLDEKPDLVIAFHDSLGSSRGTKDTVTEATRRQIRVQIIHH